MSVSQAANNICVLKFNRKSADVCFPNRKIYVMLHMNPMFFMAQKFWTFKLLKPYGNQKSQDGEQIEKN